MHPLKELTEDQALLRQLADTYGTPLYVYDLERLKHNLIRLDSSLSSHFNKYHICYAVKANSNPFLLKEMRNILPHLGADCSSPGEIYAVEKAHIEPHDCIYTGNYESKYDLKIALEKDAFLNLDDISSFDRLKEVGSPNRVSFRLNPGFGKGTFSEITTAGENAKFGIPANKIGDAYLLAKSNGVDRFGLQCMAGSGNLDEEYFIKLLSKILHHTKKIEHDLNIQFEFISMGGGFGIPYEDKETPLNYDRLFENLSEVFYGAYPDQESAPSIWIEPGKTIIGDAGLILTEVTGLKTSYKNFIGLDAGMETLMRPALYGAFHRMYKVGGNGPSNGTFDFTGPICENTDRIAFDREFTSVKEGDLITIMDAGAYGYAMSHNFNTRPRAAEVLLDGHKHRLIRKRETVEDIFAGCDV